MFKRLFSLLCLIFLIFLASRALVRALPGDPAETLAAETGTAIPVEVLRRELHLDRPFFIGLAEDLRLAVHGNLGRSITSGQAVFPLISRRFLHTVELTLAALALGLTLSLLLAIPASVTTHWPGRFADRLCTIHGAIAAALPVPWIGPILTYLLAVKAQLFPIGGHIALPAFVLAIGFSGLWARLIRERVRTVLRFGAAPGARARGIPEWKVLIKYGLAPASGALLAYLGTQFGALLGGAFITEVIFDWPGMGSLLVDAVLRRDYPVVEAAVFVTASASILGTAFGDWMQTRLDPRRPQE